VRGPLIDHRIALVRFIVLAVASLLTLLALTPGCGSRCKAQEAHGLQTNCGGGTRGYMWTGTSCIYTSLCNCTGPDCQRLYATQESCETAAAEARVTSRRRAA